MTNKILRLSAISAAIMLSLAGCGSDDNNDNNITPDVAPTASDVTVSDSMQWMVAEGSLVASDGNNDPLTVSLFENGEPVSEENGVYTFTHGIMELNGLDFKYTNISGTDAEIDYTVTAQGKSASAKVVVTGVNGDPLVNQQWHLRNTGQKAYALSDEMKQGLIDLFVNQFGYPEDEEIIYWNERFAAEEEKYLVPGEDINAMGAYMQGVTGAGVTAVVVDEGLEIRHEDLSPNVLPNRSLNLNVDALDRTDPTLPGIYGDHGTSVAGLIAAKGWNGLGGRGVAPDTGLIGMNLLSGEDRVPQTDLLIHGFPGSGISATEEISAFNRSYGITYVSHFAASELDEQIESYPNLFLRGGKGATNMKSSGNSFISARGFEGSFCEDNGANDYGLTCVNGNSESSQTHPYYFSIAAVDSNGKHTSYSTAGANVLVSAPAGEFGRFAPAMITTDQMTCLSGYSSYVGGNIPVWTEFYGADFAKSQYPFNYPGHPDNASCNYTSTFNGTSSAAPNASGVVSLMLSANNELTWRDVRHILAVTSTKNDAEDPAVTIPVGEGEFVAHEGWVQNAAGYNHNNLYGFGRVDAGAAVAMAKSYDVDLGDEVVLPWQGEGSVMDQEPIRLEIPDNNAEGATYTFTIVDDLDVEAMQFKFDVFNPEFSFGNPTVNGLAQSTAGTDLAIEVTSPSGTRAVLLSSKQAQILPAYDFYTETPFQLGYILKDGAFLANAFYGESAKGEWTIRLIDTSDRSFAASDAGVNEGGFTEYVNNRAPSVMTGVAVRVFGHRSF